LNSYFKTAGFGYNAALLPPCNDKAAIIGGMGSDQRSNA